ncbi:MAG TPA: hypothetical protein VM266_02385 [Solirubrobacteraceae bacterium]|nr:hypothetical protein [Solirubrobacteraceae bacterium]
MLGRSGVVALLALALLAPAAHAGWREPVSAPLDATAAANARTPATAALAGVPYVAWQEDQSIRVARLGASGWEPVGGALATGQVFNPAIAVDGGSVVVAWEQRGEGIRAARLAGAAWQALPVLGNQYSYAPSIESFGGALYAAYYQYESDGEDVRVARLDGTGWQGVGGVLDASERDAPLLPQLGVPDERATDPVLAAGGDRLYAGWAEGETVRVARLDGTSWPLVGGAVTSTGSPFQVDLTVAGATPYVAWTTRTGRFDVHVARFDGSAWAEPAPAVAGDRSDLATIGGAPWLSWREGDRLRVARLGTTWEQPSADVARSNVHEASLVGVNGIPFAAFGAGPTSATQDVRVSRLEPESLSTTATAGATEATLVTRLVTFGLPYPVAFDVSGTRTPAQVTSGDPATVTTTVGGLRPRTTYTATPYAAAGAGPEIAGPPVTFTTTKRNGR